MIVSARAGMWLLALLALGGCHTFAGKDDYADYRAVRLASGEAPRLLAMQRYVAHHPDGHWHEEIEAARQRKDVSTFEARKGSRAGLTHYLAAFPDGAFAAQARSRLSAIDLVDQHKREAVARAVTLEAERKQRSEELRRTWIARFASHWVRTLLALSSWGEPIADVARANPVFSRAFGAEPRPRCTADQCVKHYLGHYAVPVPGGTRVERSLALVLRLRLSEGKLQRAELLFPAHGFSRFFELENARMVVDSDAQGRADAVAWALGRLSSLFGAVTAASATPEQGYALAPIDPLAIGPSGELTDTAAEDPGAPPNRLDAAPSPDVDAFSPTPSEPAADMVFTPLTVDKQGRAHASPPSAAAPSVATGEIMQMAPLTVPKLDAATGSAPAVSAVPQALAAPDVAQPMVRAFLAGQLRLVMFSAAGDATAPAYDGIVIERVASAPAPAAQPRPRAKAARAVPRAARH